MHAATSLSPVVVQFGTVAANDPTHTPDPAPAAPVPTTFDRESLAALLLNGFGAVDVTKADGSSRTMVVRLVKTGPERTAEDARTNNVTVYSMHDRGIRRIKLERLHEVRVAGVRHVAAAELAVAA